MTVIEDDSVEMLPDNEPDNDNSIPSAESIFSCVERTFMYPYIISDEAMDGEEKEFDLDMDIIVLPLARPKEIPSEKGTMLSIICMSGLVKPFCTRESKGERIVGRTQ